MGSALVRIAPLLAAVSFLLGGVAGAQQYPEPSQSVTVEGDTATVEGSGCDPLAVVAWTLHRGTTSTSPVQESGSTQADADGQYEFSINVSDKQGRYTVRTQCGDLVQETSFNAGRGGRGPADRSQPDSAQVAGDSASNPGSGRSSHGGQDPDVSADARGHVSPLSSARLAFTGGDVLGLAVRGAALLVVGALLLLYRRTQKVRGVTAS